MKDSGAILHYAVDDPLLPSCVLATAKKGLAPKECLEAPVGPASPSEGIIGKNMEIIFWDIFWQRDRAMIRNFYAAEQIPKRKADFLFVV